MALNITKITLTVRIKENDSIPAGVKEAKEIALEFFHKCTTLAMDIEHLDAEYEEVEEINDKESYDIYTVTYDVVPKKD